MRYLGLIGLVVANNLFAFSLNLTNKLPEHFGYEYISFYSTSYGDLQAKDSVTLDLPEVGAALNHGMQLAFAIFPSIERMRVNACCQFADYKLIIDGKPAVCGLSKFHAKDMTDVVIEPCE